MIKEVLSEANEELRTDECITTKKTKKMKTATEKEIAIMKKELEKAREIDLDPRLTHLKKYSNDQVDVYLIRLTVGEGGRYFFGYLSKPKDGRKHPVNQTIDECCAIFRRMGFVVAEGPEIETVKICFGFTRME